MKLLAIISVMLFVLAGGIAFVLVALGIVSGIDLNNGASI